MKRKNSSDDTPFTECEIELMKDVTQPHKALAKRFGKSTTLIQTYRRHNLGIYLRGLHHQMETILETADWQVSDESIARTMKVSPETVTRWRQQLFGKPKKRIRLSKEQQREIASSVAKSSELAVKYGVTVWTINRTRRKYKTAIGGGRPRLTLRDFPTDTNWRLPTSQIASNLGISWLTANRLRTESLIQTYYLPTLQIQMEMPSILADLNVPSVIEGIACAENASLLSTHLKLDKREVSRLKSTAKHHYRKTSVA